LLKQGKKSSKSPGEPVVEASVDPCLFSLWLDTTLSLLPPISLLLLLIASFLFPRILFLRLPLWILTHTIYRVRAHGLGNVPATGPVLLVAEHMNRLDPLMILAARTRRIRFVVWSNMLEGWIVRWMLRFADVIAIDGSAGPRALTEALRLTVEALERGEAVCLFADNGVSRTGFSLPFQRGFDLIVKRRPAPIVPVCLDYLWGSIYDSQGIGILGLPKKVPCVVHVHVGSPLPASAQAYEVRQAIQLLSAESAVCRAADRQPIHRQFLRMACRHPFRLCFVDPNSPAKKMVCYGEALAGAKILARLLRPRLADDEMVGVWLPPGMGASIVNISLAFLRKTVVNLNYTSPMSSVQSALRQCGIRRVLTSRLCTAKLPIDPGPEIELIYLDDFRKEVTTFQRLRTILGVLLLPRFVQEYWQLGLNRHQLDDLATVIFSSGSTGEPKGIMLTHSQIAANVESVIQAISPGPADRLVGILPFFHSFGYTITLWAPLQVGASVVFHPNPLQAKEIGELTRTYRGTIFLSTPTFLRSFLKRCEPGDFSSLRLLICGAEKMPPSLAAEFYKKFGIAPREGYGCTELAPVVAANLPDFIHGSIHRVCTKPATIGRPIPGVAVKVVNNETFEPLPPGMEGLLLVYGANVMKGYLGRDDLTRRKIIDGWYITGDLARLDEDGFITITGREERFAKVGGEMVPLERIEEEIHSALETSERICAVTAIPDERKGERIVVLHLSLPGLDVSQLWERLNDRGLPNLYVPGPRDFFQVGELPVLGSGKLDLKKCKEKAVELALRPALAREAV
jgi:acyl-[acyl-carrier-protein]-phospholipid O-acyltransferase/long-chain-fatty-acid--[acyl-carrier-protein] ligase